MNGCFVKWGVDAQEALLRDGAVPASMQDWGKEDPSFQGTLSIVENGKDVEEKIESEYGSGQDFYKNIVAAIKGEEDLFIKPEQARDVIRLLELAEKSWSEQRTIPLEGELIS